MPLLNPIVPLPPPPAKPPDPSIGVAPVRPVTDEEGRRGNSGEKRRKRRALLDLLMEEVEAIPGLADPDRERIRRNLRDYVRTETIRRPPAGLASPAPGAAAGVAAGAATVAEPQTARADEAPPEPEAPPQAPIPEVVVRAALPAPSAEMQQQIEEAARLEDAFRQCLALHTEPARKIASYIHALQTLEEAPHLVTLET